MAEKKKIVRLADVGELENILKKDLAEEEEKGKDADTLFCEDVAGELTDLESLPTIDPESLRPVSEWELAWEDVQFGLEYYKQPLPGGAMFWKRIDQNRQHAGIMNYDDYAIILQDGKFFTCGWIPKISVIAELVRYFVLK